MCCRRCLEAAPDQSCPVCAGVFRDDAYAQLMRLQDAALRGDDARSQYDWSWWEYRGGDGETFAAGEKFDARVVQFDRKARRVQVSIKALEVAEEKEAMAQFGSADSGASLGDILGAAFNKKRSDDE